jgi:hypothetical protein
MRDDILLHLLENSGASTWNGAKLRTLSVFWMFGIHFLSRVRDDGLQLPGHECSLQNWLPIRDDDDDPHDWRAATKCLVVIETHWESIFACFNYFLITVYPIIPMSLICINIYRKPRKPWFPMNFGVSCNCSPVPFAVHVGWLNPVCVDLIS